MSKRRVMITLESTWGYNQHTDVYVDTGLAFCEYEDDDEFEENREEFTTREYQNLETGERIRVDGMGSAYAQVAGQWWYIGIARGGVREVGVS